jgi:hypothetical protein
VNCVVYQYSGRLESVSVVTYRYRWVSAGTARTRLEHAQLKSVSNCSWPANSSHKRCKISSGSAGCSMVR